MSRRTLYKKLVDSHTGARIDEQHVLLYADLHIMNEYTSAQASPVWANSSAGSCARPSNWPWCRTSFRPIRCVRNSG